MNVKSSILSHRHLSATAIKCKLRLGPVVRINAIVSSLHREGHNLLGNMHDLFGQKPEVLCNVFESFTQHRIERLFLPELRRRKGRTKTHNGQSSSPHGILSPGCPREQLTSEGDTLANSLQPAQRLVQDHWQTHIPQVFTDEFANDWPESNRCIRFLVWQLPPSILLSDKHFHSHKLCINPRIHHLRLHNGIGLHSTARRGL